MAKQAALQNNFIGGLKTEFTGLNFPENSCTDVDNCIFTVIGDVLTRKGIDFESNYTEVGINTQGEAISYYRWRNAGGDGETEVVVVQVGGTLYFFQSSDSSTLNPLSTQILIDTISLPQYLVVNSTNDPSGVECQYADGNGNLFVYHPYCNPFYVNFIQGGNTPFVPNYLQAVTLIPGSTMWEYEPDIVTDTSNDTIINNNQGVDVLTSLQNLTSTFPNMQRVSLVVSWFGNDLRVGSCTVKPEVLNADEQYSPRQWLVSDYTTSTATVVSTYNGSAALGGSPDDISVINLINQIKGMGLKVTLYPVLQMDIPGSNSLPNPYSDNAGTLGQSAYPWRGYITCSPARGYAGTVDLTSTATSQIASFFGGAEPSAFTINGDVIHYSGSENSYRRFILHYATLAKVAGGVDAMMIGSELKGITQVRSSDGVYPGVLQLSQLATDVASIGGASHVLYGADWSEFAVDTGTSGNEVWFNLDTLWSNPAISAIGIDWYQPMSDWRQGSGGIDAKSWPSIYSVKYLQSNINGGENYDWYYASQADRDAQIRTTITDTAYNQPWVFQSKNILSWWQNEHYNRPNGVISSSPTSWVPQSKPIWFTEMGCGAVNLGTNQPNVFFDPESSSSGLPYYSNGERDDNMQIAANGAFLQFWVAGSGTAVNPISTVYGGPMVPSNAISIWTWDARPYPAFPDDTSLWADYIDYPTGQWLEGRNYQYNSVSSNIINLTIRDFAGINDTLPVTTRPSTLSSEHNYNLLNQGWGNSGNYWSATTGPSYGINTYGQYVGSPSLFIGYEQVSDNTNYLIPGTYTLDVSVSNPSNVAIGQDITITGTTNITGTNAYPSSWTLYGAILQYSGGSTMQVNVQTVVLNSYINPKGGVGAYFPAPSYDGFYETGWTIVPTNAFASQLTTWHTAFNDYPSNADVWFEYIDSTGVFDPANTIGNVSNPNSPAANGHFILSAFNQQPSNISGVTGLTSTSTSLRPSTGAWWQGRVWYTGVNATEPAEGDAAFYTWTENIYFSQIITGSIITGIPEYGQCYQTNDPTDRNLFNILPSDGGVIVIQGSGAIYKLFVIQNGMLVFAQNGIWFITGSQGIGFTATDYTITKISAVQSISPYSVVDVNGLPFFWNEEGIYVIQAGQNQGMGLTASPVTLKTILSFYNDIPLDSKIYARGSYNPITYVISWVYRSTQETGIINRYQFDSVLSLNTLTNAFYPYSISSNNACYVCGIIYLSYPNSITAPAPAFKYLTSVGSSFTFSEEKDDVNWVDWYSYDNVGVDYTSYFEAGYSLAGKAIAKWQPTYVDMYSRNTQPSAYTIQGIWDFASSPNSGKYTVAQTAYNSNPNFGMIRQRHKIRGHGISLQIVISSVAGKPFDIMGWGVSTNVDNGE